MGNQNQLEADPSAIPCHRSALAVWSVVLSVLSFLLVCPGPLVAMAAVVCGHLASVRIRASNGSLTGAGAARAGLVMGYAAVVVYLVIVPLFVFPALDRSRERIRERICEDNIRQIATACLTYAERHGGYPPADMDSLRPILGVSSNGLPLVFLCPASKDPLASSYEIVATGSLLKIGKPAHVLLVREKEAHHHGRWAVAYADGAVDWMNGP